MYSILLLNEKNQILDFPGLFRPWYFRFLLILCEKIINAFISVFPVWQISEAVILHPFRRNQSQLSHYHR